MCAIDDPLCDNLCTDNGQIEYNIIKNQNLRSLLSSSPTSEATVKSFDRRLFWVTGQNFKGRVNHAVLVAEIYSC